MKHTIVSNKKNPVQRLLALSFTAFALAAGCNATAQTHTTDAIEARYRLDVQRCHQGDSAQDLPTCLKEAAAAHAEARKNLLTNNETAFRQNQVQRCNALPPSQREDCLKQMEGADTKVMGSVEAGGVLRETTIIIPGKIIAPGTGGPEPAPAAPQAVQTLPVR